MDRTTTQAPAAETDARRISFLVRMAKDSHRGARKVAMLRDYYQGQRFAFLLAARHLHPGCGARITNFTARARRAA